MKKNLLAGLVIFLPIALTLFVLIFLLNLVTDPFVDFFESLIFHSKESDFYRYHGLFSVLFRLLVLVVILLFVCLVGALGRRLFFPSILNLINRLLTKIPVIRTVYNMARDVSKSVFAQGRGRLFRERALAPFPHGRAYSLGLVPCDLPQKIEAKLSGRGWGDNFKAVFVPTAPHPISGFLLMYSECEAKKVEMTTEELFKFLLSCGISQAGEKSKGSD